MSRFPYHFFDEYVFRTPLFSRKQFLEMAGNDEIQKNALKSIYADPVFQEAIYLASPYLHKKLNDWLSFNQHKSQKENQKLENSFLKYYSRMSTRSIPFGLFTEVGVGQFGTGPNPFYGKDQFTSEHLVRETQLDMHFLVGLAGHLVKAPEIRNKLLFYPNNSIYTVRNRIRYVEYEYTHGKREYIISSAQLSDELQDVLDCAKKGKTIQQLSDILINEEITSEEATEFINELIDNQVLVSELEPNVSGKDFLDIIIGTLQKTGISNEAEILSSIQAKLDIIDTTIGNPVSLYAEIEGLITLFNTEYDQKYLFQTDLYFKEKFILPPYWKKELKEAVSFLNKIKFPQKDSHLERFKKAFHERFEKQEMPLAYVLDTEIGIGYRQDIATKGLHPYIENLDYSSSHHHSTLRIELDPLQQILNEKVQEALLNNQYKINLSDKDFEEFEENWSDLPDTISFVTEIISENNQEKLSLSSGGGGSAANLLARFCSEKSEVQNLTKCIAQKEQELNAGYISAEIIHLPEARIGNVIRRPTLRPYEIPFLAQSVLPEENQISVDDLYISLKNNRIVLRSKKLDKEIKPYLTNSHNYSANPLPVYHFLCDLNRQNIRSSISFNWGDLKSIYQFLPRVEYKNSILSKAWWKITEKELTQFSILSSYETGNKEQLLSGIKSWRNKRQIPQWIQWVQSDNKLTINLDNYDLVIVFIDTVKKLKSIVIEEFLYNENTDFVHQFIFSMYREGESQELRVKS
ncbi:lantibiotic dehydratase family protein [Chryseobacterium sp. Bi04]|uniref:lantibiotic dehydratase family protein n=1 Tax=Chryseobacterium sp. Bi04 TaxID=2822345 RepID=UPI001E142F9C|nr:lantibiotic dehydratase family protein [Chryseobacterium sp. Bi04]CAH0265053.1 Nisin biosynthesis protein NisB [Chryseobacterium sp. Bi04]